VYLKIFITLLSVLFLVIVIFIFIGQNNLNSPENTKTHTAIASRFLLTDLCLSTESRHTRHLSRPELIAPFQDAPGYIDHFPSSTFIGAKNLHSTFTYSDSIIVRCVVKNVMIKYAPPLSPLNIRGDTRLDGNAGQAKGRGVNN